MAEAEEPRKSKQEAKSTDNSITQPPTALPQEPPSTANTGGTNSDPNPPEPILVQLVGGDDLKPFETQTLGIARETLDITRRTYRIAVFGFLAAVAAAVFVGSQVEMMSYQTQIMGSQTESAAASGLLDQMNTRKQLEIAQQQAKTAEDQVTTIQKNFVSDERPYIWFTNDSFTLRWDVKDGAFWNFNFTNYGKSPAVDEAIERRLLVGTDAWKRIKRISIPNSHTPTAFLPPTKTAYASGFAGVSKEEFDEALKHNNWIVLYGSFVYYDLAGNRYVTDFCVAHLSNGSYAECDYDHKKDPK